MIPLLFIKKIVPSEVGVLYTTVVGNIPGEVQKEREMKNDGLFEALKKLAPKQEDSSNRSLFKVFEQVMDERKK